MSQKVCHFFLKGTCKKGSACNFSHNATPQQPSYPQSPSRHEPPSRQPYLPPQKQDICRKFQQTGSCRFGNNCRFLHDTPPQFQSDRFQQDNKNQPFQKQPFQNQPLQNQPFQNQQTTDFVQETYQVCEEYIRHGHCRQRYCQLPHRFSANNDLLLLKFQHAQNGPNTNNPVIRFQGVNEVFMQNYLRVAKISTQGQDQTVFGVQPQQNVTCHTLLEQKHFLGISDNMKQSSIFCLESPALNISPAHQDVISEIFPVQLDTFYLASASFDGKVKFWKLQNNVFVLAFSLQHNAPVTCCQFKEVGPIKFLILGDKAGYLNVYQYEKNGFTKACAVQLFMTPVRNFFMYDKQSCILALGSTHDILVVDMNNFNNVTQWNFDAPVLALDLVQNLQQEDIFVVGTKGGTVYLVPFMESSRLLGKINLHLNSEITTIKSCRDEVNEVIRSCILIGDKSGRYSYFQFISQQFQGLI